MQQLRKVEQLAVEPHNCVCPNPTDAGGRNRCAREAAVGSLSGLRARTAAAQHVCLNKALTLNGGRLHAANPAKQAVCAQAMYVSIYMSGSATGVCIARSCAAPVAIRKVHMKHNACAQPHVVHSLLALLVSFARLRALPSAGAVEEIV